ncbi:citrate transporter [Alteromonas pelagimontana]|uniref:Citrate transporter n=1 Tax=Alteromonas pelagimontana TaxID=1858656 RepID=A0A6M4MEM1_9ALTE|nr:citrate:proton symporter [Alteromonas pelagimontana]QJR81070.1 citrate transporter [Alteromonas pelagimontana]
MLAVAGLLTIIGVLIAIMSKRLTPLVALIAIPALAAIAIGQARSLPSYMVDGISTIAPVAVMFMFAILFFGIMNDAGVFRPFINFTLKVCGSDPRKLFIGVVVITALVHLDGSGASTFLIVIPAVLPLFDEMQIDRRILACLVAMSAGVNNMLPWGGPTIRAAAALDIPVMELYQPLLPVHIAGFLFVVATAYWLGTKEKRRLAGANRSLNSSFECVATSQSKITWTLNVALIVIVIGSIIFSLLPPVVAFIGGSLLALLINHSSVEKQKQCIDNHAKPAFMMVSILFAAGCFTGILRHSGMLDAMAQGGSGLLPSLLVTHLPFFVALIAMPLSLLFDPDSFYFGIMPVLSGIAVDSGGAAQSVAHGALLGQMTTGFPVSPLTPATFLLIGLTRIGLADHQRFSIPYLYACSLFMTFIAVLTGVISL